MRKVYMPMYDSSVGKLFKENGWHVVPSLRESPDLVCFTGGADVSPSLYGHPIHTSTFTHAERDKTEEALFKELQAAGIPSVGICRGGQFLNVMHGGCMYQDVTDHTGGHKALITGDVIHVSSTHHQMMQPGANAIILGVGFDTAATRTVYDPVDGDFHNIPHNKISPDIEVVAYGTDLCFQPHPEFAVFRPELQPMADKFFHLIETVCFKEVAQTT